MFNMLASIAEFENDLRTWRQAEGTAKAKKNGVKFGRPAKLTDERKEEIYSRRLTGATISQIAKEFRLGEATIYRALNSFKDSEAPPKMKITKVHLWLRVENNSKFVRGKTKSRQHIEQFLLSDYDSKKIGKRGCEYELTFHYQNDDDLEEQINGLAADMSQEADMRNGFIECDFSEVGTDRSW